MVQKRAPNKLGIKPYHLKPDNNTHLVNLKPSSPQTHDLKKIMKKSRSIKRLDESANLRSTKKKRSQPLDEDGTTSQKQSSPNYMKSTSCFDARKERSPSVNKNQSPKAENKLKKEILASGNKGSKTSSLKLVRTLTKSPSFKPLRSSKKCSSSSSVILCEDLDAKRATCSSTLKDSKFPDSLELSPGGTELTGTSAMKVCPYTYCSLNGHHRPPLPPLRCFMAARRRALKTQKSFKLGCLSPRHAKKKTEEIVSGPLAVIFPEEVPEEVGMKDTHVDRLMEEENKDFFIEIYSKDSRDSESSDIDWEEGNGSASCLNDHDVYEEKIQKTGVEIQDSYDERSVSSGGWSEENADSESDSSYQETKTEDQDFSNYDAFGVSSTTNEVDFDDKMDEDKITKIIEAKKDELQGFAIRDQNIKCSIDYKQEKTSQESETAPETEKRHTTIIYNIIQFNISIYINGEKTDHSEAEKGVTVQVPATADKMESEEANEAMVEKNDDSNNLTSFQEAKEVNQTVINEELPFDGQEIIETEQLNAISFTNEHSESLGVGGVTEEHEKRSEEKQTHFTEEIITSMDETNSSLLNDRAFRGSTRGKKPDEEMEDYREFNPRGPNFLPEVGDPDGETVDLRHQEVDERKQSEEWMVDYALQQAVTTLKPARKRKVALLVEAFEKVMPIPKYDIDTHNRRTSKAFTNARPMQACS